jgi:hypothetical protein
MTKGKQAEKGLTNKLSPQEAYSIIRRFDDSDFQVQVERDLRGARYKLYDALGMWLNFQLYIDEKTYETIEKTARDYINGRLVPGYFSRLQK